MTRVEILKAALELPAEEQLRLAQRLWENLSPPPPELSAEQRRMLETRRAEAEADPGAGVPWDEVKARIFARPCSSWKRRRR